MVPVAQNGDKDIAGPEFSKKFDGSYTDLVYQAWDLQN